VNLFFKALIEDKENRLQGPREETIGILEDRGSFALVYLDHIQS
jgi:hypothetical protein